MTDTTDAIGPLFCDGIKPDGGLQRHKTIEDVERDLAAKVNNRDNVELPSDYALAQLSNLVYNDVDSQNGLPDSWEFVTAAWNEDVNNGYFGAAYLNEVQQQVVVVHRGTDISCWGALWTDLEGIVCNAFVTQLNSAITFAHEMSALVNKINNQNGSCLKISFTGHSLGAWLAQITAFTTEHLTLDSDIFVVNSSNDGFHAHTVVFDSPGCKEMLEKLRDEFSVRYPSAVISLDPLDVSTYLSTPNRVNTYNTHLGALNRVFIELSGWDSEKWFVVNCVNAVKNYLGYKATTLATHSIVHIADCFDAATGSVKKDNEGKLKMRRVLSWPSSKGRMYFQNEYNDFFREVTAKDKYDIESDTEIVDPDGNLRYKTSFVTCV